MTQQNPPPRRNELSKTIDILGIGKKPPSPYTFKSQEKSYQELAKRAFDQAPTMPQPCPGRLPSGPESESENKPKKMVDGVGSSEMGVAPLGDRGFLSAVVHSYNNHYILQTTPEDWWYTIICKIATAVEEETRASEQRAQRLIRIARRNLNQGFWVRVRNRVRACYREIKCRTPSEEAESGNDPSASEKFREFFVSHEGKITLTVAVSPEPLRALNYTSIFRNLTEQIRANIKVPEFAETVRADFSTSTPTHVIESEITLMSSMKNYFEYKVCFLCGIPQIEMMGTEEDWRKLKDKFIKLRKVLGPVETCFDGFGGWWDKIEVILQKLIDTYMGDPDLDWWSRIFNKEDPWGSGSTVLKGWFIEDFLNGKRVETFEELPSGLTTVPLILEGAGYPTPVNTTLVAGIAGIQVDDAHKVPKVKALHGWALFVDEVDAPEMEKNVDQDEIITDEIITERMLESEYTAQWDNCE